MITLRKTVQNKPVFSRIYVENRIRGHEVTGSILKHFPNSRLIPIRHYKDVFSRPGQDFAAQKAQQQMILAKGRPPFLYKGADVCPSFGNSAFYYASSVMNCIYDCSYCYLQGMYPSANLAVFVNIEDIFSEIDRLLEEIKRPSYHAEYQACCASRTGTSHGVDNVVPFPYICNSYDTDLLSLRGIIPLADRWLDFASDRPGLLIEMRTKSAGTSWIRQIPPLDNVIIAWTLSPGPAARAFEQGAPPLMARLKAAGVAIEQGWRVRICIDPMLFFHGWKQAYAELVDLMQRELDSERIESISFGVFRMGKDFLKRARKARPDTALLSYPYTLSQGVYTYPDDITRNMVEFLQDRLLKFMPAHKLFPQEFPA